MADKKKPDQSQKLNLTIENMSEDDRLRRDIYRPDIEKLQLFVQMLRTNALFKNAKITHK